MPCYYGIDTPTRQELIASSHDVEETRKYVTADSLAYLGLDGLKKIVPDAEITVQPVLTTCTRSIFPVHILSRWSSSFSLNICLL